ncbi:MAG: outer membrane protein assembly factor BamE [Gemmataceae bacterium]|nr:outer membrane protein assembly factor BamE [Gemmataceae bacterium]
MPRIVYLLGWALLLVAGAFLLTDALLWRPGVSAANVRRIRPGMTKAEVESILGGSTIAYSVSVYDVNPLEPAVVEEWRDGGWRGWAWWEGRSGNAEVWFVDQRVTEAIFHPPPARWSSRGRGF